MNFNIADPHKHHGIPLLALPVICMLDKYLARHMTAFEWGSGGSSVFIARRVGHLTSIEHDPDWFKVTQKALAYSSLQCDLALRPPVASTISSGEARSTVAKYKGMSFQDYVNTISGFPDEHFDFILVDGRARCACLERAVSKLKTGGLLVLDNADRGDYRAGMALIKWPVEIYESPCPFFDASVKVTTAVWMKE